MTQEKMIAKTQVNIERCLSEYCSRPRLSLFPKEKTMGRVLVWHAEDNNCLESPALKAAVKTAQQIIEIKRTPDRNQGQYPQTQGLRRALSYIDQCMFYCGCRPTIRCWKDYRYHQQRHIPGHDRPTEKE
jgi:hypothetical protein